MEKKFVRLRRATKARCKIKSLDMPRLCVHRSPRHIYAQVIMPDGKVVAAASTVDSEIKKAILARDTIRLNTMRLLKSALTYHRIEKKLDTLSDNDLIIVVQRLIKQHLDSIDSYRSAGRQDLLQKEEAELAILREYTPQPFSAEELEAMVKLVIAEVGATSKAQMGLVMKAAIAKAAGRSDGKAINTIALKLLT